MRYVVTVPLLLCVIIVSGCGRSEPYEDTPRPRICWATLSNRMAYLSGWMSAGQCGIIDNTKREVFGKRRGDTCTVGFDIAGGEVGHFEFTFLPDANEAQARYVHPGNVNDGAINAWPCPKERFQ